MDRARESMWAQAICSDPSASIRDAHLLREHSVSFNY